VSSEPEEVAKVVNASSPLKEEDKRRERAAYNSCQNRPERDAADPIARPHQLASQS